MADDSELVRRLDELLLHVVPVLHGVEEVGRELVDPVKILLKDVVQSEKKDEGIPSGKIILFRMKAFVRNGCVQ